MSPQSVQERAGTISGVLISATTATCTQSIPGSVLDFFVVSQNAAIRSQVPRVYMTADISPRRPVPCSTSGKNAQLW
eukprot:9427945-Pyramimonas_sp.AAC.1